MKNSVKYCCLKLLCIALLLPVFSSLAGCKKDTVLETSSDDAYTIDFADEFYKYSIAGKENSFFSEWKKAHLISTLEDTVFSIKDDKVNVFDFNTCKLTEIDYSSMNCSETMLDSVGEKKILNARFSCDKLLIISFLGDEGFSYTKYYFDIYDLQGRLENEIDVTDCFGANIPQIGLSNNDEYPLFAGTKIVIWNALDGSVSEKDTSKEFKKDYVLKDVKCLSDDHIALVAWKTNETGNDLSKIVVVDQNLKTSQRYEIRDEIELFAEGNDLALYGDEVLITISGDECKTMFRWEELLLDMPCIVSCDDSHLKIIGSLLSGQHEGLLTSDYEVYLFNVKIRESKPEKTIRLASFGNNEYYDIEFLTGLFNLTNEEYKIELKSYDIDSSSSYSDFTASYRKAWLETSKQPYDIYYFPFSPLIDVASPDVFIPIDSILSQRFNNDKYYYEATCGNEGYFLRPFFSLAGSIYSKNGLPEEVTGQDYGLYRYYELLPGAAINQDSDTLKRAMTVDPVQNASYVYESSISIDDYIKICRTRDASISGFPDVNISDPMINGCGAFAFGINIEKEAASAFADFLLSSFIQSFSYGSDSIIPVNKEAAELQFYAFPFFDLSGVLSDYHVDGEKVDIKKASVIEKDMLALRSFLNSVQAAKTVYVTDPVISIIFSEEYMRFINGTVSKEEFIDSYYRRISLYLKERGN